MSVTERIDTPAGKLLLHEFGFRHGGREWSILHTGAVWTEADETHAMVLKTQHVPYGISLWPSAIALAREVAGRQFAGQSVLELGAGTGLPGIIAATLGGKVVQTDNEELVLDLCRRNGERNGVAIEYRRADWTSWDDGMRYDWILGADIIYTDTLYPRLRKIFASNVRPGGRILLSDPFRSVRFLEELEGMGADGWAVTSATRDVGGDFPIGVYELVKPG